jgi:hypothetical protein
LIYKHPLILRRLGLVYDKARYLFGSAFYEYELRRNFGHG